MKVRKAIYAILVTTFLLILTTNQSKAAALSVNLHSASGLANSYAGSSTGAHDASDMVANPATLAEINSKQLIFSYSYLDLKIKANTNTDSQSDAGVNGHVPAFYFATPISDKINFGISSTTPYALGTKYSDSWSGNSYATESSVATVNVNPALSYKINNKLALAGGVQVQYIEAVLKNYFGAIPVKITANDIGYGYNLGLNYKINDKLKFGIGYNSKIDHKLKGKMYVLGGATNVTSKVTTPEAINTGLSYQLSNKSQLLVDLTWTRWSRVNSLVILDENYVTQGTPLALNFKDSLKYSLGYNYQLNEKFLVRTGVAYEKDAVTDTYREPRVPTGDRIWTGFGFSYKISGNTTIDTSYLHQFFKTVKNNANSGFEAKYKSSVDVLAVALKYDF